jgi:hypothetical protein
VPSGVKLQGFIYFALELFLKAVHIRYVLEESGVYVVSVGRDEVTAP